MYLEESYFNLVMPIKTAMTPPAIPAQDFMGVSPFNARLTWEVAES
jgi:hypothetical protein